MLLAIDQTKNVQGTWKSEKNGEEKAKEENWTSKEIQQEQEVAACTTQVLAAHSAVPFLLRILQRSKPSCYPLDSPTLDRIAFGYNYRQYL